MAEEAQDSGDKQHEPTRKKLEDARKKGDIVRSNDVSTAASYAGLLLVAAVFGAQSMQAVSGLFAGLLARAGDTAQAVFSAGGVSMSSGFMRQLVIGLAPWFTVPALAVLAVIFAQRGFVFAPDKLVPKLQRISLLSNAKNKFNRSGLFEFAKSLTKLTLFSVILGIYLWRQLPAMIEAIAMEPAMVSVILFRLCLSFLLLVLLVSAAIAAFDYLWQRHEFLRKNRMSHKEMTDETKQNEGDPHMKQQRRQRGYEIAMNQMLAEVPTADVIVVNPTHYAVALKWSREPGAAPVCVAKGVDEIAARIREIASENGIPIHRDPPTARAIHATVEIGQEIRPDHYEAVAVAIKYAETMRQRARKMQGVGNR